MYSCIDNTAVSTRPHTRSASARRGTEQRAAAGVGVGLKSLAKYGCQPGCIILCEYIRHISYVITGSGTRPGYRRAAGSRTGRTRGGGQRRAHTLGADGTWDGRQTSAQIWAGGACGDRTAGARASPPPLLRLDRALLDSYRRHCDRCAGYPASYRPLLLRRPPSTPRMIGCWCMVACRTTRKSR